MSTAVNMRAGRWALAVAAASCRHSPCASPRASALVHYVPRAPRASPSSATSSTTTSIINSGYSNSAVPNRLGVSPCRAMLMSTSPGAEGGGGGGESWCGHELLNTVTTEWVEDHLHDPEVCLKPRTCCAHVYNWRDCHVLHTETKMYYHTSRQAAKSCWLLAHVDCRALWYTS